MYHGKSIAGTARLMVAMWLAAIICAIGPLTITSSTHAATGKSAASKAEDTTSAKVQQLLTLLADPKVQEWLEKEGEAKAAAGSASGTADNSISHELDSDLGAIREH